MKNTPPDISPDGDMLSDARFLYRELARSMRGAITRLSEETTDVPAQKTRDDLIKSHHKQLQQVLSMEAELVTRSKTAGAAG